MLIVGVCFRQPQLLVFRQKLNSYFDIMEEEGNITILFCT